MIVSALRRDVGRQFIRFCFIGLESTILNYLLFLVLLHFAKTHYLIAFAGGFIAGTLFGFYFNKLWSFESSKRASKEIGQYFLVYLFSMAVGALLLKYLVGQLNLGPIFANIPVLVVTTLTNFFGTKILVFKNKRW